MIETTPRGLKHGTGGEARAHLCHSVPAASKLAATFLTLALLAAGVTLAARYGDFSMRAGDRMKMGADSGQSHNPSYMAFMPNMTDSADGFSFP